MTENSHSKRIGNAVNVQERLSSLPDDILIDILSCLEIHNAAATSVLSRRWRDLWTAVTRFKFLDPDYGLLENKQTDCPNSRDSRTNFHDILRQLKSPKLYAFDIHRDELVSCAPTVVEECLRELCCRKVEQIRIHIYAGVSASKNRFFHAPASLFRTQSLVTLELHCVIHQLPENAPEIQLPNLKKLHILALFSIPLWLGTLFSSCPLLEDLQLICYMYMYPSLKPHPDLQIFGPNLKSLNIGLFFKKDHLPRTKIFIDAPILTSLKINDHSSCYYFVQKPLGLIKASVNLRASMRDEVDVNEDDYNYEYPMSKFVAELSSVHELQLNIFVAWERLVYTKSDLVSLRKSLDGMNNLIGWNDLLLSLQRFPNLNNNNLKVDIKSAHYSLLIYTSS